MRRSDGLWLAAVLCGLIGCSSDAFELETSQNSAIASDCDAGAGVPARFTRGEGISKCGRSNPLDIDSGVLPVYRERGTTHVLEYPVSVTGFLIPYQPMLTVIEGQTDNPIRRAIADILPAFTGLHSMEDLWDTMGLVRDVDGSYLSVTKMATEQGVGLTFSCTACHSGRLFGQPVIGLHNRRSRANEMFETTKPLFTVVTPNLFKIGSGATDAERAMWSETRRNMRYIDSATPRARGLDSALAHTMMSLALREDDPWATKSSTSFLFPRRTELETHPNEVKPATWWLTKYKNKWFSDGSLVSGNPVLAALLVNEFGRGSDLREVDQWLSENQTIIDELTTAVFSTEAPSYFDFFEVGEFDLASAMAGQEHFVQNCSRCHGTYRKGWERSDAAQLSPRELVATTKVEYWSDTPIRNVGTDAFRRESVNYMLELNDIQLNVDNGIVMEVQEGYVPPPLVGIWARWPYFHNMSAPSLCAVLTRADERPVRYRAGEPIDRDRDFDAECNGYPESAPAHFDVEFDTRIPGLGNSGHDERIFLKDGEEVFSPAEKRELIRFLQTL